MIPKIGILIGMLTLIVSSCQQNDLITDINSQNGEEEEKAAISVALTAKESLAFDTDYVPMDSYADANEDYIRVSNSFNYIIVKNIHEKWVVDTVGTEYLARDSVNIRYNSNGEEIRTIKDDIIMNGKDPLGKLSVLLTPGEYQIMIFTGQANRYFNWNTDIKRGLVLTGEGDPYACRYKKGDSSFENRGLDNLAEEVFYGRKTFTVTKTDDLHTSPTINNLTIPIERRVGKFRVAVKYSDPVVTRTLNDSVIHAVIFDCIRTDGKPFASGLDPWGNLWYDSKTPLNAMKVYTYTYEHPFLAEDNETYYLSTRGVRIYAPYFFTEPGTDIEIRVPSVFVSGKLGSPVSLYEAEQKHHIKHNTITGFIVKPTDVYFNPSAEYNYGLFLLDMVYDNLGKPKEPVSLFSNNFEHTKR